MLRIDRIKLATMRTDSESTHMPILKGGRAAIKSQKQIAMKKMISFSI